MLTQRQHQLLGFIHRYVDEHGVPPSFDEMRQALRLKSKSGVHRLIMGLEERGYIRRLPYRARALEVLRAPESCRHAAPEWGGRPTLVPNVVKADFGRPLHGQPVDEDAQSISLPLYGRIAAGTPIEALRDQSTHIEVPAMLLGGGEHYALEVAGDSMEGAGILDGDIAIIKQCDTAENGTIVVALVDDSEATLKRLRRKGASVALEAANPNYETRIFGPNRVKVQGRLVGLFRRY